MLYDSHNFHCQHFVIWFFQAFSIHAWMCLTFRFSKLCRNGLEVEVKDWYAVSPRFDSREQYFTQRSSEADDKPCTDVSNFKSETNMSGQLIPMCQWWVKSWLERCQRMEIYWFRARHSQPFCFDLSCQHCECSAVFAVVAEVQAVNNC